MSDAENRAAPEPRGIGLGGVGLGAVRLGPLGAGLARGGLGRVAAEELLDRRRLRTRPAGIALDAEPAERAVHRGQRLLERAGLVGDAELQERAALHDGLGAGGLGDAGQLDDDAAVAHLLDERLGHAELVDALAQHGEGKVEIALGVGRDLLRLVELEGEVHPALQIESQLERHPLFLAVRHHAGLRIALADGDVSGHQEEDAEGDEAGDYEEAITD